MLYIPDYQETKSLVLSLDLVFFSMVVVMMTKSLVCSTPGLWCLILQNSIHIYNDGRNMKIHNFQMDASRSCELTISGFIIQPNSKATYCPTSRCNPPNNNNFVTQHNSSEGRYARERTDTEDVKIEFRNSEFAIS